MVPHKAALYTARATLVSALWSVVPADGLGACDWRRTDAHSGVASSPVRPVFGIDGYRQGRSLCSDARYFRERFGLARSCMTGQKSDNNSAVKPSF